MSFGTLNLDTPAQKVYIYLTPDSERRFALMLFSRLLLPFVVLISALNAQIFTDDFNRPDASMADLGNGWSTWAVGTSSTKTFVANISSGVLQTFSLPGESGGAYRALGMAFPLTFSFDFATNYPSDGGWDIRFNDSYPFDFRACNPEFALSHSAGAAQLCYLYRTTYGGTSSACVPIVSGQQAYQQAFSHIFGTVYADLSATVIIRYPDASQVTIKTPAPTNATALTQGSFLALGNPNDHVTGTHTFDNFSIFSEPIYSICTLYDSTKAVKGGATLPVKVQLCDSSRTNLSSSTITLHAGSITQVSTTTTDVVQDAGNANPDSDFRYDPTLGGTGGYVFNLSTTVLSTGSYNLNFTVAGDSWPYSVPFQVR